MNSPTQPEPPREGAFSCRELTLPELVAEVYDQAPDRADRVRLLQPLLGAMGLLSLAAVAGGVFSWLRLNGAFDQANARLDALSRIGSSHVLALAELAQQVDPDAMQGLVGALQSSPSLCATAAAGVLLAALARKGGGR